MGEQISLPSALEGIFFAFRWDKQKVWRLNTPVETMPLGALTWHLDLPVWSTEPPHPLFNLEPRRVIERPGDFPHHWNRILAASLAFPLELFLQGNRWVILDGYHRLAQHYICAADQVCVRKHPASVLPAIMA